MKALAKWTFNLGLPASGGRAGVAVPNVSLWTPMQVQPPPTNANIQRPSLGGRLPGSQRAQVETRPATCLLSNLLVFGEAGDHLHILIS